jgi:uncharacterized protein YrzB (UPF0473 family)
MEDNVMENAYFTLTDENGNEINFEVIGECEKDGQKYFAVVPVEEEGDADDVCEYGILKLAVEGDEEFLVTVDDDDEFDDVADYFDDLFSSEIDYDA